MRILFIIIFLGCFSETFSQNLERAREHIALLCSKDFEGRGYTNDGHTKAADFIEDQFKKFGLKPLKGKTYQQQFKVNANTFNGKHLLKINGKKLKVGEDYIVEPSSPAGKGRTKVTEIDTTDLRTEKRLTEIAQFIKERKTLLFNNIGETDYKSTIYGIKAAENPPVLFEKTDDKLTWHISSSLSNTLHFKIKESVFPSEVKRIKYKVKNEFIKNIATQNVVAEVKGTTYLDSIVLFTAHYDHIGQMDETNYVAGANDNASGTSMLINLAEHYAKNPAPYTTVFIAFGGEELGLLGSKHFVDSWWLDLEQIKFQINLDIVGGGSDGVQIVNSRVFSNAYNLMDSINTKKQYLKQLKLRGAAYNSDHAPFYEKGVPCFFIYTLGGPPHYHDVFDRAETLPLTGYEGLFKLIVDFVGEVEGVDLQK